MNNEPFAHNTVTRRSSPAPSARRRRLLALVLERGPLVRNGELAPLLGVSVHTVQHDLATLAAAGLVEIRGTRHTRQIYAPGRAPAEAPPPRPVERRRARSAGIVSKPAQAGSGGRRSRKCLCCGLAFESEWVGHRVCSDCKARPFWSSSAAAAAAQHGL